MHVRVQDPPNHKTKTKQEKADVALCFG